MHKSNISAKVFEVLSKVLVALFPGFSWKVDLLTIETINNFTYFNPFISALAWKHKCKVVG